MKVRIVNPDAKLNWSMLLDDKFYFKADTAEIDLDIKDPCDDCPMREIDAAGCAHRHGCRIFAFHEGQKSILDKLEGKWKIIQNQRPQLSCKSGHLRNLR